MRRPRHALLVMIAAALLSCAPAPPPAPVERSRVVAATPGEARARLDGELRRLGFATSGEGYVRAAGVPESWAECRTIITAGGGETSSQRDFARPQARSAAVSFTLTAADGGTEVRLATRFAATYTNRFRNTPFTAACGSTGELERSLLAAAG